MDWLRSPAEIAIGVIFGVGAVFNALYTLSHTDDFYGSFARGAWFGPGRRIVERVVLPNGRAFTVALITFQVIVAATILTRGDFVTVGLLAGAAFSVLAALVSSPGGALGNLVLAVLQGALALAG